MDKIESLSAEFDRDPRPRSAGADVAGNCDAVFEGDICDGRLGVLYRHRRIGLL